MMDVKDIQHGWDVFGSDGEKVGDVSEVHGSHIVVSKGFFFPSERYIPVAAITRVEHDRVYLNVTKEQAKSQDWGTAPKAAATGGRAPAAQAQPRTTGQAGERIELSEEELRARTETAKAGEVGVRKDVVTEQRTMDVPVTREEVDVQRRPVERRPADRPVGEGEEIRVPVHEEQVRVEKEPVVKEEIEVGKRQVQETEQVSGTVRREEARVESEGDVERREGEPRR